jgi:hypothetical protein
MATFPGRDPAAQMWSRTDLTIADVDSAHIYDGFSIITTLWLEALGVCGTGEAGAYIEGGHRISRDGELPLNTNGGQLSSGRLHGFGICTRQRCNCAARPANASWPNSRRSPWSPTGLARPSAARCSPADCSPRSRSKTQRLLSADAGDAICHIVTGHSRLFVSARRV